MYANLGGRQFYNYCLSIHVRQPWREAVLQLLSINTCTPTLEGGSSTIIVYQYMYANLGGRQFYNYYLSIDVRQPWREAVLQLLSINRCTPTLEGGSSTIIVYQ